MTHNKRTPIKNARVALPVFHEFRAIASSQVQFIHAVLLSVVVVSECENGFIPKQEQPTGWTLYKFDNLASRDSGNSNCRASYCFATPQFSVMSKVNELAKAFPEGYGSFVYRGRLHRLK